MKFGRLEITKWEYPDPSKKEFTWFEYLTSSCKCKFLTIMNVLFVFYNKDCKCGICQQHTCVCEEQ